jgi:GrpB-like predicted nucleotidyltransferase (UPF0157 family)
MTFKKYKFRKYDSRYPELFRREKSKLRKILGKKPSIIHVGSTAVPGLGGKGIIDILISVDKGEVIKVKEKLIDAGYEFRLGGGEKGRLFFRREYSYGVKSRMVHLQLTTCGSHIERRMLNFKKRLLEDKKFCKEYALLKKEAVKHANGEGKKYREHKKEFIDKVK